jgi:NitT/TauT family transport system ATP-binding protein
MSTTVDATPAPAAAAPAPRPHVVVFDKVGKTYGEGPGAYTAIKDVSFVIDDRPDHGEFVAILGPSGCGKSTILRMIAGLSPQHPPSTGRVEVFGKPVGGAGADRGMVFQDYTSFEHLSVVDNIAFGLECRGMPREERRAQALLWLEKVGLDPRSDASKYPHELSGGMRQRVAIARTLILNPRIILMDEPFGALDPTTRYAMQDLLVGLWREQQATVFFITHSIEEAVYLGDRVLIMSRAPGTILHQLPMPPPDRPAREMHRDPAFIEVVNQVRDIVEALEAGK